MSILSVDTIQPIGSGSTVTLNAAKIVVGTGITFESNGQAIYAGIITATSFSGSGANLTSLPAGQLTGTVADARISTLTASKLSGALPAISGANLTSLPAQATIANNADNRIITGGSGVNLNGESTFTYGGSAVTLANANPQIRLTDTDDSKNFDMVVSGGNGFFSANSSGMNMVFEVTGSERLRIASDGKITVAANSDIRFTNGTWTGEVAGKIQQNSNNLYIQGGTGGIRFRHASSGVNQFSMTNGGDFQITNGNVVVASGHGIDFSATPANAGRTTTQELLDDYEEGTFTASMQGGSNSGSFSGSQQSRYVKIGKQVTCWIMIHGDLSGASGNLEWTGFPFTSENPQEAIGALQFNNMRGGMPSGTNTVFALMHPGLTRVHFRCNADGNNTAYTALSSSTNYGFTYARLVITYTTAS